MTTERDIFERWYVRVAAAEAGRNITAEQLKAMRQGDHYGEQRIALNSKWEAWQACADKYGRVGEPGTAETPDRDKFEEWWSIERGVALGMALPTDKLKALRVGDRYPHEYVQLNRAWIAWQYKLIRKLPEKPELDLYDPLVQQGIQWALRQVGQYVGAEQWIAGDGTETVEGDVWNELDSIFEHGSFASQEAVMDATASYLKEQYGNSYGLDHPTDRARIKAILADEPWPA